MPTSLEPMTELELRNAQVMTAREIGFIHDNTAGEINDPEDTLLGNYIKDFGQYVKFVIAQNTETRDASLGIFYAMQSAAPAALALLNKLNNGRDRSQIFSALTEEISYGPGRPPKTLKGFTLIGGGQIDKDEARDRADTQTLQSQFGLGRLSREHMKIVRELVFQKLGI